MRKRTGWFVLAVALVASALTAEAQLRVPAIHDGARVGPVPPGPPVEHLLDLTETQRAAAAQLRMDEHNAARAILDDLRLLHEALRESLEGDAPDPTLVGQQVIAAHVLQKRLQEIHEGFRARFVALLTDEQRQTLEAFEKAHGPRPGPGMHLTMPVGPGHAHGVPPRP